ncbi:periplasmic binding family protein [Fluviicoccus keumensis]|uniref:Periplasmic binding family protein n=1 Tax=Fluviicoccus keumensis TaxID=1435465 RepID=A0A4Q7ZAX9_9GAMM|nr:substrate-binding domain-containing protein [Fluviicoccus keumensis]RZU46959.1 periplasmic binding family protein [Fluviicoccus keumensis]
MFQLNRIALAVAAMVALPAFSATVVVPVAQGTLYGGGATLPAGAYIGNKWLGFSTPKRHALTSTTKKLLDADPAAPDSLFGYFTQTGVNGDVTKLWKVSYCATGSGTGRNVIRGTVDASGACPDYSVTSGLSFGADKASADFAATDAPFSASEYASFLTGPRAAGKTAIVQLPAVAGAIGIIYNNADLGNVALNLTESQICQIFAGTINNWNQLNSSLPSKAIIPVVRSDSSGTSFSFTNHLSATCPSAFPTAVTGFSTNSTFAAGGVNATVPSGTIQSSGNGGVVTSVLATDGTIGYAEVADGEARAALAGGKLLRHATVSIKPDVAAWSEVVQQFNADGSPVLKNGAVVFKTIKHKAEKYKKFDPIKDLPASVAVTAASDKVLGSNDANGRPTILDLTPAAASAAGCVQLVDPAVYAKPAVDAKKNDYKQYPIVAVSYLIGYNTGNADMFDAATSSVVTNVAKADAVRALFKAPYGISTKVKTIGKKSGFAALTLGLDATANAASATALVDRCIAN